MTETLTRPQGSGTLLEVEGVTKTFHVPKGPSGNSRLRALDGLRLVFERNRDGQRGKLKQAR